MKYYTVEFRSPVAGEQPIFIRGIKANNSRVAFERAKDKLTHKQRKSYWESKVYLSKHRPTRYKHSKHSNKLRKPWAVLAKNAKRQHFNVLNSWSNLHYARLTYMAWEDDTPPVFPVMSVLDNLFGPFTEALLTGDESKLPAMGMAEIFPPIELKVG